MGLSLPQHWPPCLVTPVLAQDDTPRPEDRQPVAGRTLVTASRRVENIQDVPMSVSAFSGDFSSESGVNQLKDLEQYTPTLSLSPGLTQLHLHQDSGYRLGGVRVSCLGPFIDRCTRAGGDEYQRPDRQTTNRRGPRTLYGKTPLPAPWHYHRPARQTGTVDVEAGYDNVQQADLRFGIHRGSSGNTSAIRASGRLLTISTTVRGLNDTN